MPQAAVLTALGEPLEIRDVELADPGPGEVSVAMAVAGVCHSDRSYQDGVVPVPLPAVLGHEGAGTVDAVGDGVADLLPGDRVTLTWVAQCGRCWFCVKGQPHLCEAADLPMLMGGLLDGTTRFSVDGSPVYQTCAAGAFSERTVVPAMSAVKIPDDIPFEAAALISCGVLTGTGAALNTAALTGGERVAVLGCGGVGLSVVQGARLAGAGEIIAVDTNPAALEVARTLGATAVVDVNRIDAVSGVMSLTEERGADVVFEVVGSEATIHQAITMTRRGGQAVLVGIPPMDAMVSVPAMMGVILQERTIRGCWYGSSDVRRDLSRLIDRYREGTLLLEPLVTRRLGLADVNVALADLGAGAVARSVVVF